MINWPKTTAQFGYDQNSIKTKHKIIVTCNNCGDERQATYRKAYKYQLCKKCTRIQNNNRLWANEDFKKSMTNTLRNNTQKLWKDEKYIAKMKDVNTKRWDDNNYKNKMAIAVSNSNIKRWNEKRSEFMRIFNSNEFRNKIALTRSRQNKVSSIQDTLYSILDKTGIKYYREYNDKPDDPQCTIGPYNFDCVIPRDGQLSILIECNGDYWHNLRENVIRDKAKYSYISTYFSDKYVVKILWEHEFICIDSIVAKINDWLNTNIQYTHPHPYSKLKSWYVNSDGWVIHRRSLYNKAKIENMTENEFANKYGYKIVGP